MLPRLLGRIVDFVFVDPVRPLEVLYTVAFVGWAIILIRDPGVLLLDQYSALATLPAGVWAFIQIAIASVQFLSFFLGTERGATARYFSMSLAAGLWTVIGFGFWVSPSTTFGAFIYPGFAILAALSGIWLGWARQKLRT